MKYYSCYGNALSPFDTLHRLLIVLVVRVRRRQNPEINTRQYCADIVITPQSSSPLLRGRSSPTLVSMTDCTRGTYPTERRPEVGEAPTRGSANEKTMKNTYSKDRGTYSNFKNKMKKGTFILPERPTRRGKKLLLPSDTHEMSEETG